MKKLINAILCFCLTVVLQGCGFIIADALLKQRDAKIARGEYVAPIQPFNSPYVGPVDYVAEQEKQREAVANTAIANLNRRQTGSIPSTSINQFDPNSLSNPYGAGSPYKTDGLMNPYSEYGSPYSNKSWKNPHATDTPKLYDSDGNYRGKLSSNPYDSDSTSNPYGKYGSPYSPDSINNPYGVGSPYSNKPIYVVPQK